MQPSKLSIADLFQNREQYLIPLFQRGYVWTLNNQIQPLWEDIIDRTEALEEHRANAQKVGGAGKLKPIHKHFLGAIVVGAAVSSDTAVVPSRDVIDGQQRTTTLQILLLALRDTMASLDDEALNDDLNALTYNKGKYRSKSDHLKVWPTNVGRDVIRSLFDAKGCEAVLDRFPIKGVNQERLERPLMVQAYLFFYGVIACFLRGKRFDDPVDETATNDDAKTVAQAIIRSISNNNVLRIPFTEKAVEQERASLLLDSLRHCFQIMRLQLDDEDDPQIIFETLNARGAPLTPSDLIRNFVFLRSARSGEAVDELYDTYWRQYDEKPDGEVSAKHTAKFWRQEERQGRLTSNRLDLLFYHYLTLRKCDEVRVSHVFEEFKAWWESEATRHTRMELERIKRASEQFENFLVPRTNTRFGMFCRRLKMLDTATPIPLVLYFLEHGGADGPEFIQVLDDLESFLVRRFVCGLTTKSYNRLFTQRLLAEIVREGKADAATLHEKLLALDGVSQRWPRDDEFERAWIYREQYAGRNTRRVQAVLEGVEFGMRTAKQEFLPDLAKLSVEHVLPQKWNAPEYPLPADTAEGRDTRWRLMHSIGNLTLVTPGFNSSLSNAAFTVKRPEIAANSSLMLNAYFQQAAVGATPTKAPWAGVLPATVPWEESAILARAEKLFSIAKVVWPCSALPSAAQSSPPTPVSQVSM